MKVVRYAPAALMTLIASCGAAQGGCTPAPAPEAPAAIEAPAPQGDATVIGYSASGNPINAERYGNGANVIVIVGQIHGNEEAPLLVADAARRHAWSDTTVWVIPTLNVDGAAAHVRTNAHGVDLNRDGALTQPESQALNSFVHSVNANLVVHVHSPSGYTGFYGSDWARSVAQQAAGAMGLAYRGYIANHPFLWVGTGGENILVEVPASSGSDCAGCSDDRHQASPEQVSAQADALMNVLDGVL